MSDLKRTKTTTLSDKRVGMYSTVLKTFKSNYFILPLIFILGLIIRSINLEYSSFDLDDAYSIYYTHASWEHLSKILSIDINPPTYYITLFTWFKLVGESVFNARFLSVLFSALSGVFIWLIVARQVSKKAAFIAILLFLLSNYQLSISLLVRSFAMSQLFAIISFYYFLEIYSNPKKSNVIFYILSTSLLLNIHQTTFLIPLIQFTLLFFYKWDAKKRITILISQGVVLLSLVPQVLSFKANKQESLNQWRVAPNVDEFWDVLASVAGGLNMLYCYIIAMLVAVVLVFKNKKDKKILLTILAWLILGFGLAFIVSQKIPFFLPKYLSFLSPAFYILMGVVFSYLFLFNKWWSTLILIPIIYSSLQLNYHSKRLENWKKVVPMATKINQNGYDVLVSPVYMYRPFTYYFDKTIFNKVDSIMPIMYHQHGIYFSSIIDTHFFDYRFPKKIVLVQSQKGHVDPHQENIKVLNYFFPYHVKKSVDGIDLHLYKR